MSFFTMKMFVRLFRSFFAVVFLASYSSSLMAASPTILSITGPAAGSYDTTDSLVFVVNFSENMTYVADQNSNLSHLVLELDSGLAYAEYQSITDSSVSFSYSPLASDFDFDGIELLEFSNLSLTNTNSESADLTLNNIADLSQIGGKSASF